MTTIHMPALCLLAMLAAVSIVDADTDFDGDGFDDLVVPVRGEDIGSVDRAGALHVIHGSGHGLRATGDQFWHEDSPGIASTPTAIELFGSAWAAADFDGDGFDDLAISAPRTPVKGLPSAGAVHVLYGSADGLRAQGDQFWHRDKAGVVGTPGENDVFGASLAAGDFDGDGYGDLAIGASGDDVEGVSGAGSVSVLYGSNNGLSAAGDQLFHKNTPGIQDSCAVNDLFGWSLATGDFDGDGRDDLAIGVQSEVINGYDFAGAVHVLYGSTGGLTASGDQFWHQDSPGIADAAENGDVFGNSLASGDFDGDGRDDLAIGVSVEGIDGANGAGAVAVLYGSSNGLRAAGDQLWHQDTVGIPDQCETFDLFGWHIAAGDFDGDGRDDLAIGIIFEDLAVTLEGAVTVLYGTSNGLSASGDDFIHQDAPGVIGESAASELFGAFVMTGDHDGDGRDDLSIASVERVNGLLQAGSVTVLYGSGGGVSVQGDEVWTQDSPGIQDAAEANDQFGSQHPGLPS